VTGVQTCALPIYSLRTCLRIPFFYITSCLMPKCQRGDTLKRLKRSRMGVPPIFQTVS